MDKQFTANEVRAEIDRAFRYHVNGMLNDYAGLLEAQEKAVPVRQFRVVPKGSTWTDVKDDEIWAAVTAHPESYETRVLYSRLVSTPEEAAPFAYTAQFEDGSFSGIWKDVNDVVNWHQPPIPLYTHPAPSEWRGKRVRLVVEE